MRGELYSPAPFFLTALLFLIPLNSGIFFLRCIGEGIWSRRRDDMDVIWRELDLMFRGSIIGPPVGRMFKWRRAVFRSKLVHGGSHGLNGWTRSWLQFEVVFAVLLRTCLVFLYCCARLRLSRSERELFQGLHFPPLFSVVCSYSEAFCVV